jgi:hypothetical protein
MRDWIDKLSFRARAAIITVVFALSAITRAAGKVLV